MSKKLNTSKVFSYFFACFYCAMKSSNKDEASTSDHDEEDAAVYIYDRRAGCRPVEKIQLGGIFNFASFKEKTRQVSSGVFFFSLIVNFANIK